MGTENTPVEGEFYLLRPDVRGGGRGHGVVLENENELPLPEHLSEPPSAGGIGSMNEIPRLRYDSRIGEMPEDLQAGFKGYWLVSEALKSAMQTMDADGFSFMKCEFRLEDGSEAAPHYLCEVVRVLDAIDEDASSVKILTDDYPNGKYYSIGGGAKFAFRKSVIGTAHVFRTPYTSNAFCDRAMRNFLIESGFGRHPNARGVRLTDASDI
ncbi:imm11 family protein [Stenotrophomonas sp. SM006]